MDIFNKAKEAATAVAGVAKQKGEELMHASIDLGGKTKDQVMNTVNTLMGQPPQAAATSAMSGTNIGGPGDPIGINANNSAPNLSNTGVYAGIPDPNAPIKPMTTTANIGGSNFGGGYQSSQLSGGFGGGGGAAAATNQPFGSQGGTGPSY